VSINLMIDQVNVLRRKEHCHVCFSSEGQLSAQNRNLHVKKFGIGVNDSYSTEIQRLIEFPLQYLLTIIACWNTS